MSRDSDLEALFPDLIQSGYQITSLPDISYNCIAWAMDDSSNFWWPIPASYYWPSPAPREENVDAFIKAFETRGYVPCMNDKIETGFQKVALFTKNNKPTHAAKQLDDGKWSSKLGRFKDISHSLSSVEGVTYGNVALFFKRPKG